MSSSGMEGRRERRGWRRCGPIEGEEEGERSGHRVDPLGRRAVTKRFANPPRSRATRGRENARWIARSKRDLLFRSIDDDDARCSFNRDTGDRFPLSFRANFRAICEAAWVLRGVVLHVVAVIGDAVERVCRDRRGIGARFGTGQPQTDDVHALSPSSVHSCPRSVAAPWMLALPPPRAHIASTTIAASTTPNLLPPLDNNRANQRIRRRIAG